MKDGAAGSSPSARRISKAYDWPGNIRELRMSSSGGVILREGDTFSIDDTWLPRVDPKSGSTRAPPVANLIEPEREIIEGALRRARARSQGEPVPQPSS